MSKTYIDKSERKSFFKGIAFALGLVVGLAVSIIAFAILNNIFVNESDTVEVDTTPAHTTEVSLVVNEEDMLIAPDESRTITGKLRNGSKTDSCYVFVYVDYNKEAWRIQKPDGWVEVSDGIYAYGDDVMTPLGCGEELTFEMIGTVIAEGEVYQNLSKEDFKISMKGMAINSRVSRERVEESYEDYENGGNEGMRKEIEGS